MDWFHTGPERGSRSPAVGPTASSIPFSSVQRVILPCSALLSLGYFCVGSYPLRQREDCIHNPHVTSEASRSHWIPEFLLLVGFVDFFSHQSVPEGTAPGILCQNCLHCHTFLRPWWTHASGGQWPWVGLRPRPAPHAQAWASCMGWRDLSRAFKTCSNIGLDLTWYQQGVYLHYTLPLAEK